MRRAAGLPAMSAFDDAFTLYLDARRRGIPVDMRLVTRAGKKQYQVVVKDVASKAEANALLARLRADLGVTGGEITE